jgi:hypothetical protein
MTTILKITTTTITTTVYSHYMHLLDWENCQSFIIISNWLNEIHLDKIGEVYYNYYLRSILLLL